MSTYFIICSVIMALLCFGYLYIINQYKIGRDLSIVASVILVGSLIFSIINEYRKEQDAVKTITEIEPTSYVETDTLKLYKMNNEYYLYEPNMRRLIRYHKNLKEDNIIINKQ